MTAITIKTDGNKYGIRMNGHAGYNKSGPDIVCAACSMLAYTLLQSVLAAEAEGGILSLSHKNDPEKGVFSLDVVPDDSTVGKIDIIFRAIGDGFALLSIKYPKNVNIRFISGEK